MLMQLRYCEVKQTIIMKQTKNYDYVYYEIPQVWLVDMKYIVV